MESKKRVTLLDIANATGYTINTVSRALKNKDDISRETCQRIQEVAHSMGYVRNYMAGALRSGRTKTIGLILSEVSNPYYAVMADEIQNVLVFRAMGKSRNAHEIGEAIRIGVVDHLLCE